MDYINPDYTSILARRVERVRTMRLDPTIAHRAKIHYKRNPIDFVADWGVTMDPRNIERGLPALIPLVPFKRQIEWMEWILERWSYSQSGLTEKSRDMGCTVCAMALLSTLAIFNDHFTAGVGSRKEDIVDKVGDPNTIFYKARMFLTHLPVEFRGGWNDSKLLSAHMKLEIPATGATIIGEAGANIGRGGRASIYLVDESAFNANQQSIDAALSQTTRCRIDLSSVNGMDNVFAEKRHSGKVDVFTFSWRDDPRKNQAWYDGEVARLNPLVVAQEIDLDYTASKEGILIPSAWAQAAIDAHIKLKIEPSGARQGALDIADEGIDLNAFAGRYGIVLEYLESWSGKGSDIFGTVARAFMICDDIRLSEFQYDADGLGAGARGDARVLNEKREGSELEATPFRGSGEVVDPDEEVFPSREGVKGRTNKDFFKNRKAQAWFHLRKLFQNTYRAVVEGMEYDPSKIISIPSELPERSKLLVELSQPTYSIDGTGKVIIDKAPDGQRSPNLADSVMILYAPQARKKSSIFDF